MNRWSARSVVVALALLASGQVAGLDAQEPDSTPAGPDMILAVEPGARFITRRDRIFCTTQEKFHEIMEHVARQESEEYRAMLQDTTNGCYPLMPDVPVTVVRSFVTYVEVRPDSMTGTIWTVTEALGPPKVKEVRDTTGSG